MTIGRSVRAVLLLLCFSVLLLLIGSSGNVFAGLASSAWPMFHHNLRHTGLSPYHDPMPSQPWKYSSGLVLSSCAIGTDSTIYVTADHFLYALNPNGTLKWQLDIVGASPRSSPAIADDGTIYVGSNDYNLYAVNPNSSVKWTYPTGNQITSSPAIAPDGTIYVGSRDGYLYAVNPNGSGKWTAAVGSVHMSSPAVAADGTIYIGSTDGNLYALNPNGSEKWRFPTGDGILDAPAISSDGSRIYFGSRDLNLYCVDSGGNQVWTYPVIFLAGSTPSSPGIGADGTVYVGSNDGILYALTPAGTQVWRYETGSDIRSSPAISADGTIYFGAWNGFIYALYSNGTLKWRYLTRDRVFASPAIDANGSVCIGSFDGYVYGNLNHTPAPANPPTDLQAEMLSATEVRLTWTDNSSDEYGFSIERKTGAGGTYTSVGTVGPDVTTFTNSGLATGETYYYRVAAYQEGGFSYSDEVAVTMSGLYAPSDLTATTVSETQIDVSWTDNSEGELGFKIERKAGNLGFFREIATVDANAGAYTDTSVNPATDYYYRVRAFGTTGYSSYTDETWAASAGRDYTEIVTVSTSRPQMALTFDAGTARARLGILQILRDYNVRCTFFVTGYVAETMPDYWIEATTDGHQVCNHSYDHPPFPDLTDEQIRDQLTTADEIIYGITGNRSRPLFRGPYGSRDARVLSVAESLGYRHVYWTVDSGDASWLPPPQEIIDRTLANAGNGAVILYHCTVENTELALPTIIAELLAQGYELVTVSELVAPAEVESPPGAVAAGWNLISLPVEPAHATPLTVFKGGPIDANLYRWGNETQGISYYDEWNPTAFGPISADEGYWLQTASPATLRCSGRLQTTPRHIMLPHTLSDPSAAWTMIGYPFETAQSWSNCTVYNPSGVPDTKSILDARDAGWISSILYGWDAPTQSLMDVGLPDDWPTTTQMEPWHGYWMVSKADDLRLIIPPP